MDKRLAALRPDFADRWQHEKTADALTRDYEPQPVELDPTQPYTRPARRTFLGLAYQIRSEADAEHEKRDALAKEVWGQ